MEQQVFAFPGGDDLHELGVLGLLELRVHRDEGMTENFGQIGFLAQQGFEQVANITGGIDAWSRERDGAIPRY